MSLYLTSGKRKYVVSIWHIYALGEELDSAVIQRHLGLQGGYTAVATL